MGKSTSAHYGLTIEDNDENIGITVTAGNFSKLDTALYAAEQTAASDLAEHTSDTGNPHDVTAEQVGLGNVGNYAPNNIPVEFTAESSVTNLVSGSTLATLFGKLAKAVSTFISHLSASNPHNISCSTIKAATASDLTTHTSASNPHNITASTVNAYTKSETYSKSETDAAIAKIDIDPAWIDMTIDESGGSGVIVGGGRATPGYRKVGSIVELAGAVYAEEGDTFTQLPAGYRPSSDCYIPVCQGTSRVVLCVRSNGYISCFDAGNTYLCGVRFPIA